MLHFWFRQLWAAAFGSFVLTIRYSLCVDDQHQLTLYFFVFGLCTIHVDKASLTCCSVASCSFYVV